MLSLFGWGQEEPDDTQQQVQVQIQIPKKKIPIGMSSIAQDNMLEVHKNIVETQQILIDTLQLVVTRGEDVNKLSAHHDELMESAAGFSNNANHADYGRKLEVQQLAKSIADFIDQFKPELEIVGEKYSKIMDEMQQLQIQIQDEPEIPPDDHEHIMIYDYDEIQQMIERLKADLSKDIQTLETRGLAVDELLKMAEEILSLSEDYLKAATNLNKNTGTQFSNNVYWIFFLDLTSSVLSLINVTNETSVAVKTATIARALFSFIILGATLTDMTQIPTGQLFGVLYIIVTWLISLTNFVADILRLFKKGAYKDPTNYAVIALHGAIALFITFFGLRKYVTGGGILGQAQKFLSGFAIDSWYLSVVAALALAVSGVKLYQLFKPNHSVQNVQNAQNVQPEPSIEKAETQFETQSQEPDEIVEIDKAPEPKDLIYPVSLNTF